MHALAARLTGTANTVPPAIRYERLLLCRSCKHLLRTLAMCSRCGCFVYEKTWHEKASCPDGLWGILEDIDPPFED